jgi:hypothetical protein
VATDLGYWTVIVNVVEVTSVGFLLSTPDNVRV